MHMISTVSLSPSHSHIDTKTHACLSNITSKDKFTNEKRNNKNKSLSKMRVAVSSGAAGILF